MAWHGIYYCAQSERLTLSDFDLIKFIYIFVSSTPLAVLKSEMSSGVTVSINDGKFVIC